MKNLKTNRDTSKENMKELTFFRAFMFSNMIPIHPI